MEMTLPIMKNDGSQGGTIEISPDWIELERGNQAVHDSVVAFQAGIRAGAACTKTRGEVRGGGAKPFRQKGTGRARMGSKRSPLLGGGGIIFGPKPRSYAKKINQKVQHLALKRTFSERLKDGGVIIVDDIDIKDAKTRQMVAFMDAVEAGDDALVVVDEPSSKLLVASRNLPGVEVIKAGAVNAYWMLLFKKIVFTRAGLDKFVKRFGPEEKKA